VRTMNDTCTWKDCNGKANNPQVADDGEVWATLCDNHNDKLASAMNDPPRILSYWILAQGGTQGAMRRFGFDN